MLRYVMLYYLFTLMLILSCRNLAFDIRPVFTACVWNVAVSCDLHILIKNNYLDGFVDRLNLPYTRIRDENYVGLFRVPL